MPQYNGVWTIEAAAQAQSNQQWVTDPNFKNTTLLLQADGVSNGSQNNTFLDSSSNAFPITRFGNATQGTFTPFSAAPGRWSNFFSGSATSLRMAANSAFDQNAGSFSVECWVYPATIQATTGLYIYGAQSNAGLLMLAYGYTTGLFKIDQGGAGGGIRITSTSTYPANAWYHVAYTYDGSTLKLFINGVLQGSAVNAALSSRIAGPAVAIGEFGAGSYFNGYVSNLRICRAAIPTSYQTASTTVGTLVFTPSTAPLTTTSQGASNVTFLTCQSNRFVDNSSSPVTITINGTPSVQPFSPFAPQFQWTEPVIGGSGYFPASGSYLTIPANSAFAPGTGDYTVDGWIYSGSNTLQTIWAQTVGGTNYFVVEANYPTSVVQITSAASGGGTAITSAATLRLNAWNHFTISRTSGVITVWCNGSAGTPTANTVNLTNITYIPTIGTYSHSTTTNVLIGYLANLRYIKGTALSGATIPTAPNTAVTNTQALLNYTNAGIYDAAMDNVLETVSTAQVSTSVVKYGSGSMVFNGSSTSLTFADTSKFNLFNFGIGDFTIDFWFYPNNTTSGVVYGRTASGQNNILVYIGANVTDRVSFYGAVSGGGTAILSAGTPSVSVWQHCAVVRQNGIVTVYLNGIGGTPTSNAVALDSTYVPTIGAYTHTFTNAFNGYLDDFRITKGVARYTANFIPPLVALPRQ